MVLFLQNSTIIVFTGYCDAGLWFSYVCQKSFWSFKMLHLLGYYYVWLITFSFLNGREKLCYFSAIDYKKLQLQFDLKIIKLLKIIIRLGIYFACMYSVNCF